jgi:hypothetical protein
MDEIGRQQQVVFLIGLPVPIPDALINTRNISDGFFQFRAF